MIHVGQANMLIDTSVYVNRCIHPLLEVNLPRQYLNNVQDVFITFKASRLKINHALFFNFVSCCCWKTLLTWFPVRRKNVFIFVTWFSNARVSLLIVTLYIVQTKHSSPSSYTMRIRDTKWMTSGSSLLKKIRNS